MPAFESGGAAAARDRNADLLAGLSFWDSLIAAAAQIAGCDVLLTEDLQDGLLVDRLRVVNPFEHRPGETS